MFYQIARIVLSIYIKLFYRVSYTYEEPLPKQGPYILTGKHLSYVDAMFICTHLKCKIYHLAKDTLFQHKAFYTKVLRALGALPVSPDSRSLSSLRSAVQLLKKGAVLSVYPEGTRIRDNELHEGGAGTALIAKMAKCDIVPFGIYVEDYTVRHFKRIEIRFGKKIPYHQLHVSSGEKGDYKDAMVHVMTEIKRLSEKEVKKQG